MTEKKVSSSKTKHKKFLKAIRIKKLEEQISFLQNEISQMSGELYSQQKEVSVLKKQILNLEKRINELESSDDAGMIMIDKKPPHY